ncbi:MAG: hypothetical protein AB7F50_05700 [Fimbriimonadaceae bacterium]
MRLSVVSAYGEVALQDRGRFGFRQQGVPPAGPFDRFAAECCAALVGDACPVLEVGGSLEAVCEQPGTLAWAGCGSVTVDGERRRPGRWQVKAGERIEVHGAARLYLAALGGWSGDPALGSVCGFVETALRGAESHPFDEVALAWSGHERPKEARIVPLVSGWDDAELRVGLRSSRAGIRLEGANLRDLEERPSVPVVPGCVQLAPSGELLVIGPDGPVTGGYRLVGWLCPTDLDRVGQWRAGDSVLLKRATEAVALQAAAKEREARSTFLAALRVAARA